ncbi:hypothetical protein Aau02nite_83990 [Amorphoplanes auranticolor]|uniref:Uncharacterized protein n=1 Tax=Actinoplanes auranticolor TaxID=47988 RepID=A0A919VW52_9ACTN|nr:hypothetical protein Aau02nite_83990 [Actinoplanes auranticolor]
MYHARKSRGFNPVPWLTGKMSGASRDFRARADMVGALMTFPPFTAEDALRLASLNDSTHVVDHLSSHRDIALARVVKLGSNRADPDHSLVVCARCEDGVWNRVDTMGGCDTVDVQFGGGRASMAGRELTYRIAGVVTLKTVVSPHGNWSFVYSDPQGRRVMGTSVVEGDFGP